MTARGSGPGDKGHGTGGSAPEVDICLRSHGHTCIYTLAHICMLHTQTVIMFVEQRTEIHACGLAVLKLGLIFFSLLVLGREERKKNKCVSGKVSKKVVVG